MKSKSIWLAFAAAFFASDVSADERHGKPHHAQHNEEKCDAPAMDNAVPNMQVAEARQIQQDARLEIGRELLQSQWQRV